MAQKIEVCETCGCSYINKYWRPSKNRKYCSLRCSKIGNRNPNWNETVGYKGVHSWISRNLVRPEKCSKCNKKCKPDAANISKNYKRDASDYIWLCRKCHMEYDGITDRLIEYGINSRKHSYIKCKNCDKDVLQYFKNQLFCSQSCSTTYHNKNNRVYNKGTKGGIWVDKKG